MKSLHSLLAAIQPGLGSGLPDIPVQGITADSRQVAPGFLFVAIPGTQTDGHKYIPEAINRGATCILGSSMPEHASGSTLSLSLDEPAKAYGLLMAAWYDFPGRQMQVVGVTGTNGKTSTATLLFDLFVSLGYTCGLLSTISIRVGQDTLPATHTTPDAGQLQALLRRMADNGCSHVFMEVSSHAVHQDRISGIPFRGALFTNITHDHLDYHGTFDHYIKAKKKFFDGLDKKAFALVNTDDARGTVMVQNTGAAIHTYALRRMASFKTRILENSLEGLHLEINGGELLTRFIGEFNAYNLTAAYGAASLLGIEDTLLRTHLSALQPARGRFETIRTAGSGILAVVDYAHTPDALQKVLDTLRKTKPRQARILTVVGCGGDRDREKRPLMARVAAEGSDIILLTSDNPRSEEPAMIIEDMAAGLLTGNSGNTLKITDRREAIRTACLLARDGDILLVAGKGHETYQETDGVRHPFDDRAVVRESLLATHKLTNP